MPDLALEQEARDDADHLAARLEAGVGDRLHHPDPAAAVDERGAAPGELAAERRGGVRVLRTGAAARAAEDADRADAVQPFPSFFAAALAAGFAAFADDPAGALFFGAAPGSPAVSAATGTGSARFNSTSGTPAWSKFPAAKASKPRAPA